MQEHLHFLPLLRYYFFSMDEAHGEYLQTQEYQIPKVIEGKNTTYTVENYIGGGRVADVGVFLAINNQGGKVAIKIYTLKNSSKADAELLYLQQIHFQTHKAKKVSTRICRSLTY